ncbi:hypothetical protein CaCOL14_010627 [Colletotrichum acutatum]
MMQILRLADVYHKGVPDSLPSQSTLSRQGIQLRRSCKTLYTGEASFSPKLVDLLYFLWTSPFTSLLLFNSTAEDSL